MGDSPSKDPDARVPTEADSKPDGRLTELRDLLLAPHKLQMDIMFLKIWDILCNTVFGAPFLQVTTRNHKNFHRRRRGLAMIFIPGKTSKIILHPLLF